MANAPPSGQNRDEVLCKH